jgi:hypothetical protein
MTIDEVEINELIKFPNLKVPFMGFSVLPLIFVFFLAKHFPMAYSKMAAPFFVGVNETTERSSITP